MSGLRQMFPEMHSFGKKIHWGLQFPFTPFCSRHIDYACNLGRTLKNSSHPTAINREEELECLREKTLASQLVSNW